LIPFEEGSGGGLELLTTGRGVETESADEYDQDWIIE